MLDVRSDDRMDENLIRDRLVKYLRRDKRGIRREVLSLLLDGKIHTTSEVYEILRSRRHNVSLKGISAMLGQLSSRLGIVRVRVDERKEYYVKSKYIDLLRYIRDRLEIF